jgi:UPF0042 nucleotide-binding protein
MPSSLLPELVHQLKIDSSNRERQLAVGIDARNLVGDLSGIPKTLEQIERVGVAVDVIFLKARSSDLLRRYSETRRKHPLSNDNVGLKEAIDLEKKLLAPIADIADRVIDSSGLSLHQLRDLIRNTVVPNAHETMSILFQSFGFKRGMPNDADFVFDVRCLPNPYWKAELRTQTGNDAGVIQFLEGQVDVASMLADIIGYLTRWIPKFQSNNRSYLTVAIGCTGGQHRSVYIANRLHEHFSKQHQAVQIMHKELSS